MVSDFPFGFSGSDPDDPDKDPTDPANPIDPANPLGAMFGPGGMGGADLGAALQRFGQLLSTSSGPVHWDLARDTARQLVAADGDPSVTPLERAAVSEAVEIAQTWLDAATTLPRTSTTAVAWSRSEWIEETLPRWKAVITPLAERMAAASAESLPGQVPEELRAMAGPMLGIMGQMSGVMYGGQVGQGLGALANEVLTSTDVGLRLAPQGVLALLPRNIAEFGAGLGVPDDQVRIYLGLREAAHTRLFDHAPWLSSRIESAVADYARGISVDMSGIERAMGSADPSNPQAIAEMLSSGVFEPPTTAEQQGALDRLELILALVEGWVDTVTTAAAEGRLPAAGALGETMRRRRASGGPAERTFETLVGLQLRPRRLREASALWQEITRQSSLADRDRLWDHPDLLPDADALDDPTAYVNQASSAGWDISTLDDTSPPTDDDSGEQPST